MPVIFPMESPVNVMGTLMDLLSVVAGSFCYYGVQTRRGPHAALHEVWNGSWRDGPVLSDVWSTPTGHARWLSTHSSRRRRSRSYGEHGSGAELRSGLDHRHHLLRYRQAALCALSRGPVHGYLWRPAHHPDRAGYDLRRWLSFRWLSPPHGIRRLGHLWRGSWAVEAFLCADLRPVDRLHCQSRVGSTLRVAARGADCGEHVPVKPCSY